MPCRNNSSSHFHEKKYTHEWTIWNAIPILTLLYFPHKNTHNTYVTVYVIWLLHSTYSGSPKKQQKQNKYIMCIYTCNISRNSCLEAKFEIIFHLLPIYHNFKYQKWSYTQRSKIGKIVQWNNFFFRKLNFFKKL